MSGQVRCALVPTKNHRRRARMHAQQFQGSTAVGDWRLTIPWPPPRCRTAGRRLPTPTHCARLPPPPRALHGSALPNGFVLPRELPTPSPPPAPGTQITWPAHNSPPARQTTLLYELVAGTRSTRTDAAVRQQQGHAAARRPHDEERHRRRVRLTLHRHLRGRCAHVRHHPPAWRRPTMMAAATVSGYPMGPCRPGSCELWTTCVCGRPSTRCLARR